MLGKGKKTESGNAASPDRSAESKGTSFLSRASGREEKTIIGEHISIEGSISGREDLEIAGSMKGNIELEKHNFRVGPSGRMDGEIAARNVSVSGEFKGNIKSHEKVELTREADFYGEIRANSISVEDGAYIKAVIELDREPNRKSSPGTAASVRGTGSGPPAGGDKKET